ncbi:endocuticle structural glycoprotein SgAbd-3-like [Neodiprion pinetum]|uniref:Cuticle protein CP14.6 n=1 Tax=Neodiprion lecontei TaxID=441921 RepID=A0A6J0BU59_NEOLC|nr:cuticle protein CP14.6 [Neodiprion lecontei]XP_046418804.1 cuticle protein CP14.6-like [Neodiprion fabricii]XP_046477023.1 cuticle protein CP14.6-like [Neodiprion pinetum]XP_046611116.1 cuticle protein CP14.6-like [Neodiprion virginianus]
MTPFTAPSCIASVYKSLRSEQESQVQNQLQVESFLLRYYDTMYTVQVLVVVALCATRTFGAPQRPTGGSDKDAVITAQQLEVNFDGNYVNNFETSNGISHQESGQPKQVDNETPVVVQGADSYTAPDGQQVSITYIADENGYQPQGSHIPTAPPIPPEILRALEWNAAHPEEEDGGQGRPPPRG